jgi:hypothetical protein
MPESLIQSDRPFRTQYKRPQNSKEVFQQYLLDNDAYATVLLVIFLEHYGTEGLEWHPETIHGQMSQDFGVKLPKSTLDKLMAAIAIVTTNYFYREVRRFIELCNILAGDDFDPTVFDPADSAEMAWAVTEALLLSPPEEGEDFDDEIKAYIGFVIREEGMVTPPRVLKNFVAKDFTEEVRYQFEDDPEMFQGIFETQQSKAAELDALVQENMNEMLAQLEALPLREGKTDNMVRRIREGMKA